VAKRTPLLLTKLNAHLKCVATSKVCDAVSEETKLVVHTNNYRLIVERFVGGRGVEWVGKGEERIPQGQSKRH